MTNSYAPPTQQQVTGSSIVDLGAIIAQMNAQAQLAAQEQAGYYQPSTLGNMSGAQPTLARDQFAAAQADAQRQYQLDLQRYGLQVAQFNYDQRFGEAQQKLAGLNLLAGLKGPEDYLKYNYMMSNLSAPPGQAADPFKFTQGMNQQYTSPPPQAPNTGTTPPANPFANQANTGQQGSGYTPSQQAQGQTQPPQGMQQSNAITGNQPADQALLQAPANANGPGWTGADPATLAEFNRISGNMNQTYNNAVAQNPNFQLFAGGGMSGGGAAIVGDSVSGRPTGHEEAVFSQGPFQVLNHQQTQNAGLLGEGGGFGRPQQGGASIPQGEQPQSHWGQGMWGQGAGGQMAHPQQGGGGGQWLSGMMQQFQSDPRYAAIWPQLQAMMSHWPGWGGQQGQQIPHAATGGSFPAQASGDNGFMSFTTHSPQDTQNAPFLQQTQGNMPNPAFQQRGDPLGPMGKSPFSMNNYQQLLPSAQAMLQGYIETPTGMGGLGGNFADELERARRAQVSGQSLGAAAYQK